MSEIDDTTYCERVGIHRSTLYRWLEAGVVEPTWRDGRLFSEEEVSFGRALISMLRKYRGRYALWEMVEVVRGQRPLEEDRAPSPTIRPFT